MSSTAGGSSNAAPRLLFFRLATTHPDFLRGLEETSVVFPFFMASLAIIRKVRRENLRAPLRTLHLRGAPLRPCGGCSPRRSLSIWTPTQMRTRKRPGRVAGGKGSSPGRGVARDATAGHPRLRVTAPRRWDHSRTWRTSLSPPRRVRRFDERPPGRGEAQNTSRLEPALDRSDKEVQPWHLFVSFFSVRPELVMIRPERTNSWYSTVDGRRRRVGDLKAMGVERQSASVLRTRWRSKTLGPQDR